VNLDLISLILAAIGVVVSIVLIVMKARPHPAALLCAWAALLLFSLDALT